LLDDLQTVTVMVAQGEHRWHVLPAQHLVGVDAAGPRVRMVRIGVLRREPNAGLDTCWPPKRVL
jgi:hypothetical protein